MQGDVSRPEEGGGLTLAENKRRLTIDLFEIGSIRFGEFRLKLHEKMPNAPLSPIYIDLRILRSFPKVILSTAEIYREIANGLKFNLIADVPTAVTPIVAVLSCKLNVPMISPRKDEKTHGIYTKIDGVFSKGQTVLLVDDLITMAESKMEAISILERNGLEIHDVIVLIDREQGGVQELERRGYSCHSAFKLKDLLRFYLNEGKISLQHYERVCAYLN